MSDTANTANVQAALERSDNDLNYEQIVSLAAQAYYDSAISFEDNVVSGIDGRVITLSAMMTTVSWLIAEINNPDLRNHIVQQIVDVTPKSVALELETRQHAIDEE